MDHPATLQYIDGLTVQWFYKDPHIQLHYHGEHAVRATEPDEADVAGPSE